MNNFNYTEKNKEELFKNGCTFFKFQSEGAIETLSFWQHSITQYVNDSMNEVKCISQSNQHWHAVDFAQLTATLFSPDYLQLYRGAPPISTKFEDQRNNRYSNSGKYGTDKDKKIIIYEKRMYGYINEINDFFYEENGTLDKDLSQPTFQIYNLNDCILPHTDGMSPGRNASLLMYFGIFSGDELQKWDPELGGELVVSKPTSTGHKEDGDTQINPRNPSVQYVCPPTSGVCALIDFTKGDPIHEVKNMNIRKFQRIVLNTFLTTDVVAKKAAHE
jgi:hypothetical protein